MRRKGHFLAILFILILSIGLVVFLKPISSRRPDGLEKVECELGFAKGFEKDRDSSDQTGEKKEIFLGVTGVIMFILPSAFWIVRKGLGRQN